MAGPIAERRPTPRIQGAFLSGTATFGDWMVWSPGQAVANYYSSESDGAFVQQAPVDPTDWANGAFMFAGIITRTRQTELLQAGETLNLVTEGYCKRANIFGAAFSGAGHPLGIGNSGLILGVGQPLVTVAGVYPDAVPLASALGTYSTPGEEGGVACLINRKGA